MPMANKVMSGIHSASTRISSNSLLQNVVLRASMREISAPRFFTCSKL